MTHLFRVEVEFLQLVLEYLLVQVRCVGLGVDLGVKVVDVVGSCQVHFVVKHVKVVQLRVDFLQPERTSCARIRCGLYERKLMHHEAITWIGMVSGSMYRRVPIPRNQPNSSRRCKHLTTRTRQRRPSPSSAAAIHETKATITRESQVFTITQN